MQGGSVARGEKTGLDVRADAEGAFGPRQGIPRLAARKSLVRE
jgi:hypothetical protein